ncbi:shaggy-related protein kinase epsilon [Hibiscus syriacus]|uniref:Shaggy-related protein kinase epsilon n=1 Tax=Hibiscus syriacus TaxID=106335 RepID=A0A6A2XPQ4_HIBSY|nr:shaggy-related protein kinase epsilon [Hibiscus syriacus]
MQHVDSDNYSSDYEVIFQDDFKDIDSSSDTEEILNSDFDEENKLLYLTKMGYSEAEASITMERCGPDSSITELTDFICAAQMAKAADALHSGEDRKPLYNDPNYKKRRNLDYDFWKRKNVQMYVLDEYRKWNLVYVGRNRVAPLEPDNVEMLLGFRLNPTRGGGSARDMFLGGINVLSLFSGISDVEIAFYCLGISLRCARTEW